MVILSDGQVHDVPPSLERLGVDAPLHLLLTGEPGERDRRLVVDEVPNYAMVGEPQQLTLPGRGAAGRGERRRRSP